MSTYYYCRRNCCLLVTFCLFISWQTEVFLFTQGPSEHCGRLCQCSALLQKCCLMFPAHYRVKCWGVFRHCPPGHLVIHLTSCFSFVFFPSLFLCWQFLITALLRRNAHHHARFTLEVVLVNCRASSALLLTLWLHLDLINESFVCKLAV